MLPWRLNKPVVLQVTTFLVQQLSCSEWVEQELSLIPILIYQQKSSHCPSADHKSDSHLCVHPLQPKINMILFLCFVTDGCQKLTLSSANTSLFLLPVLPTSASHGIYPCPTSLGLHSGPCCLPTHPILSCVTLLMCSLA